MAAGWGTALQSGVNGYVKGMQIGKYIQDMRAEEALKAELRAAAASEQVTERVEKPPSMDNRDVGQPGEPVVNGGMPQSQSYVAALDRGAPLPPAVGSAPEGAGPTPAEAAVGAAPSGGVRNTAPAPAALAAPRTAGGAAPATGVGTKSYQFGGKSFGTREEAQAAADAYNGPGGISSRMSQAYLKAGRPEASIALQMHAMQAEQQQLALRKTAEDLKRNGVDQALARLRATGNPADALVALKGIGMPVDGQPVVKPVELEIPGIGKIGAFDVAFNLKNADGTTTPMSINTHQATMALAPYKDYLTTLEKGVDLQTKAKKVESDAQKDRADLLLKTQEVATKQGGLQETIRHNQKMESIKDQPKPMPPSAVKMEQEHLDAIGTASSINADLGAIKQQIASGKLSFGPMSNLANKALNAAGMSTEESRNFASFQANMEKLRNDSLRLNKGVQTDGDAQRAWNELMANINDTKVVMQRLEEIQRLNERAVQLRQLAINDVRATYNQPAFDTSRYQNVPAALGPRGGAAGKPTQAQAEAAGAAKVPDAASYNALPSGALFTAPDGSVRRKP